jgi:NIMA (never in mitosis gene a)-related kinase
VIKIGDLGISKLVLDHHQSNQTVVGTPFYLAPELCKNEKYSFKSDIWSLGCILYKLCSLRNAFESNNLLSLARMISEEKHPRIPSVYSQSL